jgi:hypothetical protein
MSVYVGDRLPPRFKTAFNGRNLERKIGIAYMGVTVDPDGTPRSFMLSAGETLVVGDRTVRLGVWRGTRTLRNLKRPCQVLICFVVPGMVLYIKGRARLLKRDRDADVERIEIKVKSVERDVHPGLPVSQGLRFACNPRKRGLLLEGWKRVLEALRKP